MNKTEIENFDATWNPMVGCSNTLNCRDYCFAHKIAMRFPYTFYDDGFRLMYEIMDKARLFTPHLRENELMPQAVRPLHSGKSRHVLVPTMGDIFSPDVPQEWIERIFHVVRQNRQDRFFWLTKNPARLLESDVAGFIMSEAGHGCWYFGTSMDFIDVDACYRRWGNLVALHERTGTKLWLSIEPLLGKTEVPADPSMWQCLSWIVIGGQTNPTKQPCLDSVSYIVQRAHYNGIPVWVKDNAGFRSTVKEEPR